MAPSSINKGSKAHAKAPKLQRADLAPKGQSFLPIAAAMSAWNSTPECINIYGASEITNSSSRYSSE
jgi:hypothetical protein